jgi:hypothetical protein
VPFPAAIQTSLLDQQLREADETRISIKGHTYPLINPQAGVEGLAYESIRDIKQHRPALLVGSDWDSAASPRNPIPWNQIDRIETGTPVETSGSKIGAVCGLVLGIGSAVGLTMLGAFAPQGFVLIVVPSALGGVVVGHLIGSMFDSTRSTKKVYPQPKADER